MKLTQEQRERRKMSREIQKDGVDRQAKYIARIESLGASRPEPWPWAVRQVRYRKGQRQVTVDTALYNLQLLETIEDLVGGRTTPADIARKSAADRAFNEVQRTGK